MIALALIAASAIAPTQNSVQIGTHEKDGDVYCDIQAREFPVHQLMQSLCRELELDLEGFEDIEESPLVTVYLMDRELHVAVGYVLGAAGLSGTVAADRITVRAETPPFGTRTHSLQASEIAFLSALQRFPDGPDATRARLELAEIALLRDEPEKAVRHYELLIEQDIEEELLIETRMKAGRLLIELSDWGRAMPHFQYVGNHEFAAVHFIAEARRELARAILMRGESRRALYMLQGLDTAIPPLDNRDAAERKLLTARAKIGVGKYVEALADLEEAKRLDGENIDELEGMDLRARALELDGKPVQAALAWLHFSRGKTNDVKAQALSRAADMALTVDGEELSVLFLGRYAEKEGVADAVVAQVNEARARLGLDSEDYRKGSPTMRLNRAIQHLDSGERVQAARLFEIIEPDTLKLSPLDRVRFAASYAPVLEERKSVGDAIRLLRRTVATLESVENRSKLYLIAGEILERLGRFDEAAAAYGGQL